MIDSGLLHELYRLARRSYPDECCGWLEGPASGPVSIRPCTNHKQGNVAQTAFEFADEDLLVLNQGLASDQSAQVIYHSHTNGRAYLSSDDLREALSPDGDAPLYPVKQLVIGLDSNCVREARLFQWSPAIKAFVETQSFAGAES